MTILCVALNPTIDVACEAARVEPIHKVRTHETRIFPGGGGVNVARVVAELGGVPSLLTLSGGATGALLADLLADLPGTHRRVPTGGMTRIAFIAHERSTDLEYRFVPEGPAIEPEELYAAHEALREILVADGGSWIVLSGSLPPGAPTDTYARMTAAARAAGGRVALDTSGEPLRVALEAGGIDLVKPSLRELESIVGHTLDEGGVREAAERLVRGGAARRVAVTLGMQGSLLATARRTVRLPALHVPVRSATGAGDSFLGAMVHHLSAGADDEQAFRYGLAAGAAAVTTSGTELCRREEVERLFATCRA